MSSATEDGWGLVAASGSTENYDTVTENDAPRSPTTVGRITFPALFPNGGEPCNNYKDKSGQRFQYICLYHKHSTGFEHHPGTGTKMMHLIVNDLNRVFPHARAFGFEDASPWIGLQQLAASYDWAAQGGSGIGDAGWLEPNQSGFEDVLLVRGQWHLLEWYMDAGTAGNANGTFDYWLDGDLISHYHSIPYVAAGGNATWGQIQWAPTWGGGGGFSVTNEQYAYIDDFYASQKAA